MAKQPELGDLLDRLDHLSEKDEDRFDEIPRWTGKIEALTDKAALLDLGVQSIWFPLNQLKSSRNDVYASTWILEQKGLL